MAILIIVGLFILLVYTNNRNEKRKWFKKLKIGDKVLVNIYSENCDCEATATVLNNSVGESISAVIDDESYKRCEQCSLINGTINNSIDNTCWYKVNSFHINKVNKIK